MFFSYKRCYTTRMMCICFKICDISEADFGCIIAEHLFSYYRGSYWIVSGRLKGIYFLVHFFSCLPLCVSKKIFFEFVAPLQLLCSFFHVPGVCECGAEPTQNKWCEESDLHWLHWLILVPQRRKHLGLVSSSTYKVEIMDIVPKQFCKQWFSPSNYYLLTVSCHFMVRPPIEGHVESHNWGPCHDSSLW